MSKQNLFDMRLLDHKISKNPNEAQVDFGIGKVTITTEPGSSIVVAELIEALQDVAMVVPLQQIVNSINELKISF